MVSSISSSITPLAVATTPPKDADNSTVKTLKAADEALSAVLQNTDLLQSLADQSSKYVPASKGRLQATLWGLFNTSGSSLLTKDDVRTALYAEGVKTSDVDAFWSQLDPNKKGALDAGDFAFNAYLTNAVGANLTSVQTAVEDVRQANASNAAKSGTLLDFISPSGRSGTMLDFFA